MLCGDYFQAVEADKKNVEKELEQAAQLAEAQRYMSLCVCATYDDDDDDDDEYICYTIE